jgi:hypothetical protein
VPQKLEPSANVATVSTPSKPSSTTGQTPLVDDKTAGQDESMQGATLSLLAGTCESTMS